MNGSTADRLGFPDGISVDESNSAFYGYLPFSPKKIFLFFFADIYNSSVKIDRKTSSAKMD
jgi:hypothetical protein